MAKRAVYGTDVIAELTLENEQLRKERDFFQQGYDKEREMRSKAELDAAMAFMRGIYVAVTSAVVVIGLVFVAMK